MSKNAQGNLTLTLNPPLPGEYQGTSAVPFHYVLSVSFLFPLLAQLFVYSRPLFPEPLDFTIVQDDNTPQREAPPEIPASAVSGRRNVISVSVRFPYR